MSNLERLRETLRETDTHLALLTHFGRVAWVSGHAAFIEKGADPFSGGPAVALVGADDSALVVADSPSVNHLQRTLVYAAYAYEHPINPPDNWREKVLGALAQMAAGAATIGYDADSIPGHLLDSVRSRFPAARLQDIGPAVDALRAIKTPDEVASLRAACSLCDLGQQAARQTAMPGKTEVEVYSAVHAAMESAVRARVPFGADVVSGDRTLEMGGHPGERVISAGELLMIDIHPRHPNSYWGDSCATFVVGGEPSQGQWVVQQCLWEAMQRGRDLLRPGVKVSEVDAAVRRGLNERGYDFAHHSGHGIGTTHFERPFIMPWNDELLAEDMVIALEPGAYEPSIGGIRLEWVFRVAAGGGEPLTQFSLSLDQTG